MKKMTFLLLLIVFANQELWAQNFNEWWRQKETQKRYLLEQAVALRAYAGTVWKCYETARAGLGLVEEIKKGDFSLHSEHFMTLQTISPVVSSYSKMAMIIGLQKKLVSLNSRFKQRDKEFLNERERQYSEQVFSRILKESIENMMQLTMLITDKSVSMNEAERIQGVDQIYSAMQETYSFALIWDREMEELIYNRKKETIGLNTLEKNHGNTTDN